MLKNIINDFVYRKVFKEVNINDIKKYYKNEMKSSLKILIFSLPFTLLMFYLTAENVDSYILSLIFFSLFMAGFIPTIYTSVFSISYLSHILFGSKKEMNKINEKKFDLNYIETKEGEKEHFEFEGYDFTKNKSNYILYKKLEKEDLLFLKDEFKKSGINEKEITEILQDRISKKDNFDITLEDFCFLIKGLNEEEDKRSRKGKRSQAENMLNNIFYGEKNEDLSVENILEKEKIIVQ